MKRKNITFVGRPVRRERISAQQYLDMSGTERRRLLDARIVAPALGTADFGGLDVRYKTPVYKAS